MYTCSIEGWLVRLIYDQSSAICKVPRCYQKTLGLWSKFNMKHTLYEPRFYAICITYMYTVMYMRNLTMLTISLLCLTSVMIPSCQLHPSHSFSSSTGEPLLLCPSLCWSHCRIKTAYRIVGNVLQEKNFTMVGIHKLHNNYCPQNAGASEPVPQDLWLPDQCSMQNEIRCCMF